MRYVRDNNNTYCFKDDTRCAGVVVALCALDFAHQERVLHALPPGHVKVPYFAHQVFMMNAIYAVSSKLLN